ncbi:hypothetical protein KFL_000470250 [Klebsormidium nitens]|uniref:BACK domain-containing protein n=1 Tax=Klebsormidium nitens TaxID=105231 RepID=A0A1Y1HQT1_KLENI|nr:hypothetical protein KFL_000470250 [Klebsormidium nitens]|eukprot:GAQ80152.1 hypothetical protein KFL_000470250 [Klebsormidium nitens]
MLFNGMKESDKNKAVIVKVTAAEKAAFQEMLRFIYTGGLSPRLRTADAHMRELVSLLLVADKFEVPTFTGAVLKCIREREWKVSDAATLADSIPEVLTEQLPGLKAIVVKARTYIIDTFKDVSATWTSGEFLDLSWGQVELLLQSDELEADHEEIVLEKLLVWIGTYFADLNERKWAVARLAPHLRPRSFGEEFLNSALFRLPELDLVRDDIRKSLGTLKSAEEDAESFPPRQSSRLEIAESVRLDSDGTIAKSKSVRWLGQLWRLQIQKDSRSCPPTVGIFLYVGAPATELEPSIEIRIDFLVKTWPGKTWKQIHGSDVKTGAYFAENHSSGYKDALDMPWDQAMQAKEYLDPAGCVCFKVEAQRVKKAPKGYIEV